MEAPPGYDPNHAPSYHPPHPMMAPQTPVDSLPPVGIPQPSVVMSVQYGSTPIPLTCPYCNLRVVTEVSYHAGGLTYLAAFGIALFLWCGCCLIPCCVDGCKDAYHSCPNCKTQLGIHKRL